MPHHVCFVMVPLFSLSAYLCCLQTTLLSMDAAPFRQFLSSKVYASKEDLSEAVGRDRGADEFCTWVLDLRFEWRSRRSVGEYIQQRDKRTVNCLPDQWFRVAEQEVFNIWSVLHKRCRPRAKRAVGVQPKSRVQRRPGDGEDEEGGDDVEEEEEE